MAKCWNLHILARLAQHGLYRIEQRVNGVGLLCSELTFRLVLVVIINVFVDDDVDVG